MLFIVHLSIYFKSSSSSGRARLEHIILYICCFMYDIMLLYVTVYGCVCFFCCTLLLDLYINMYIYICTIHGR